MGSTNPLELRALSLTRTPRHKVTALLAGLALAATGLAACEPEPTPPPKPPASRITKADIDTFTVSVNPSSTRGNDTVLRIMNSDGKQKVGYISFPVSAANTTNLKATLGITPRHSGFALAVHNTGSFTNHTTFETRPALGSKVGTLASTTAGARQRIALTGVKASNGRVYLAITTSSAYELEITSTEGAPSATAIPALDISGATPPPTTPTPPTTQPTGPDDWNLSWSDEFNGTKVDGTKWNVYDEATPWNSVESPKASTSPKASNVSLSGGLLIMRTKKSNGA
ncbi:MAG TPA: hypothetical protein VK507_15655, partial [Iamia sp.]|nr:hypothetical protein [Iamia sp.]